MYAELMALIMCVLYLITVLPDSISRFIEVEGAADSVYSRLLSLRRQLWIQGGDSITAMIGFKLDTVMATGYESMLLMFNLFIILHTDNAIEVLLDALAFIFVAKIDEEIVQSSHWDPNNRWITAGAIQVVTARIIRFRSLGSPEAFSTTYGIPLQTVIEACDEDENVFKNREVANSDANDVNLVTKEERVLHLFRDIAKEIGNKNALDEYRKPTKYFGVLGSFLGTLGLITPIFMKYTCYCTWSRWQKVLYLAPVPDLNNLLNGDDLDDIVPSRAQPFANYYPSEDGVSWKKLFVRHTIAVLKNELPNGLKTSCRQGQDNKVARIFIHIIGYMMTVTAYLFQIALPTYLIIVIFGTVYELITMDCLPFLASW